MVFYGVRDLLGGASNGEVHVNAEPRDHHGQWFHYRPLGMAT